MNPKEFYHWLRRPANTWTSGEIQSAIRFMDVVIIVSVLNILGFMLHDALRAWTAIPISVIEHRGVLSGPLIGAFMGGFVGKTVLVCVLDRAIERESVS